MPILIRSDSFRILKWTHTKKKPQGSFNPIFLPFATKLKTSLLDTFLCMILSMLFDPLQTSDSVFSFPLDQKKCCDAVRHLPHKMASPCVKVDTMDNSHSVLCQSFCWISVPREQHFGVLLSIFDATAREWCIALSWWVQRQQLGTVRL